MPTAVAQASLDRIFKSGEFVCRPHRQIFVEHQFFNVRGQVSRQATKQDLLDIADTGNRKAVATGDLSPVGLGHTKEPVRDDAGNIVRRFSEEEQPKPIGYLHNYIVEALADGRWALFADEWIQKVVTTEKGELVDGVQYAMSFPRRSPEYFPTKKWIDWLALLRTAPALDMGLDLVQYAKFFPDKLHYEESSDGTMMLAAVEDSDGKWRYAARDAEGADMADDKDKPSSDPAGPPDDRPPLPSGDSTSGAAPGAGGPATPPVNQPAAPGGGLHPLHQRAAEQYHVHNYDMHPSHSKALMHHMHAMYGAQLGLNPDKHTPHVPQVPAAAASPAMATQPAPAPPNVVPGNPNVAGPHQQHSPVGLQGDSAWQKGGTPPGPAAQPHQHNNAPAATGPGVPGGGNAYIPGSEKQRMSAVQEAIQHQQFSTELAQLKAELQAERQERITMQREKRRSDYERDLTGLLGMGYRFSLAEEVEDGARWDYSADDCKRQIERIKKNYARPTDGDHGPVLLYSHADGDVVKMPSRAEPSEPENVSRELARQAQQYMLKHNMRTDQFNEAVAKVREGAA